MALFTQKAWFSVFQTAFRPKMDFKQEILLYKQRFLMIFADFWKKIKFSQGGTREIVKNGFLGATRAAFFFDFFLARQKKGPIFGVYRDF